MQQEVVDEYGSHSADRRARHFQVEVDVLRVSLRRRQQRRSEAEHELGRRRERQNGLPI